MLLIHKVKDYYHTKGHCYRTFYSAMAHCQSWCKFGGDRRVQTPDNFANILGPETNFGNLQNATCRWKDYYRYNNNNNNTCYSFGSPLSRPFIVIGASGKLSVWFCTCFVSFLRFKCPFVATLGRHRGHMGLPIHMSEKMMTEKIDIFVDIYIRHLPLPPSMAGAFGLWPWCDCLFLPVYCTHAWFPCLFSFQVMQSSMLLPPLRPTTFNTLVQSWSFSLDHAFFSFLRVTELSLKKVSTKSHAGGQWLYFRSVKHLGSSSDAKDSKNIKKVNVKDQRTERQTLV